MIYSFYLNNIEIVYFVYGLAFFAMGVAIGVKNRHFSNFTLARHLWALSAFGLFHAMAEWATVFVPIQRVTGPNEVVNGLKILEIIIIGLSFAFLLHFGIGLFAESIGAKKYWVAIPWVLFIIWLEIFLLGGVANDKLEQSEWIILAAIWARYLLALPGSLLTAWALYLQVKELTPLGVREIILEIKAVSIVFVAYGIFAGVVVGYGEFFPANLINKKSFAYLTGIPIELLRAACAVVIAWFSVRLLKIFQAEQNEMLQEMERTRASFGERERIRQDLHDGIIQSIYAVGLRLECASRTIDELAPAKEHVDASVESLNKLIRDVREVLGNLRPEVFSWEELKNNLDQLVKEMEKTQNVSTKIKYKENGNFLSEYQIELVYRICKEALHNISKHAKANQVSVGLFFEPEGFYLEIVDNGSGFDTLEYKSKSDVNWGNGLKFMQDRARSLGGHMLIESKIGKGTSVKLWIPAIQQKRR